MIASKSSIFLLWALLSFSSTAARLNPGPRYTQARGTENIWVASTAVNSAATTYTVLTLGSVPTLVYNEAKMPVMARNARAAIGGGQTTTTLHYDFNSARKRRRRAQACPGNFVDNNCPNFQHPGYYRSADSIQSQVTMYTGWESYRPTVDLNGVTRTISTSVIDVKRLGQQAGSERNGDGSTMPIYIQIPLYMSCEEWPPATSIEGGLFASRTCAIIQRNCDDGTAGAFDSKGWKSEQNWQGDVHSALRVWSIRQMPGGTARARTAILKYEFRIVNLSGLPAAWATDNQGNIIPGSCQGPLVVNENDCI